MHVKGDTVELPATFRVASTGVLTDPTTLELALRKPDGTLVTYTQPDAHIIRDSVGTFRGVIVVDDDGQWLWEWTATGAVAGVTNGALWVEPSIKDTPTALTVTYATVGDLRAELTRPADSELADRDAEARILAAEDLIDRLVGARTVSADTGRKIRPSSLAAWQATKLKRATVLIAAAGARDPAAFERAAYDTVEGPDFKVGRPIEGGLTPAGRDALIRACALLDEARLRVLTASLV